MEKNEILCRYKDKQSIRQISRETGFSRNTVKKYIRENKEKLKQLEETIDQFEIKRLMDEISSPPKRKSTVYKRRAFTDEVKKDFDGIIEIYEQKQKDLGINNKQHLTAVKIHKELLKRNHNIGLTVVSEEYRKYKNKQRECFIKQDYAYGQRAEFDWHIIDLLIDGEKVRFHQVTIAAPKSGYVFELLYENETTEVVIESLIKFFEHSGGVFKEIVFDNTKAVVKRLITRDNGKEYVDELIKLSNYYGFRIETTNVRAGNEKGTVENAGRFTRNEFFSLNYKFPTKEAAEKYLEKCLAEENEKKKEEWEKEVKELRELPTHRYIISTSSRNKVNSYAFVSIKNNFYSVPDYLVGEYVDCTVFSGNLVIYYKNKIVAKHTIKKGFSQYSISIFHYLNTILEKPNSIKNSLALHQTEMELQKLFEEKYSTNPTGFVEYLRELSGRKKEEVKQEDNCLNQLSQITQIYGGITE